MAGRPKGLPKTGGRRKGVPNIATRDVKAAAQKHGLEAIKTLAKLMTTADSDTAKIAACDKILDRAYGKPTQRVAGDADEAPISYQEIVRRIVG